MAGRFIQTMKISGKYVTDCQTTISFELEDDSSANIRWLGWQIVAIAVYGREYLNDMGSKFEDTWQPLVDYLQNEEWHLHCP